MRSVCLVIAVAGCTASASEVAPPGDTIFYPTGLAIAPDESVLFVANGNGNLQYDAGSIAVLDLAAIDQIVAAWTASQTMPDGCMQDTDHVETLVCEVTRPGAIAPGPAELAGVFRAQAGVRIGNFATDVAVQTLGNGDFRVFVPTRGDPSIAWADWDGQRLACTTPAISPYALCDDDHRLAYIHNDPNLGQIPAEPFDVFADSDYAIVTHLDSSAITLVDSPPGGAARIADVVVNLFQPDQLTGLTGTTGVAGRTPSSTPGAPDVVYVGSRSEARIQTVTVGRPADEGQGIPPYLVPGPYFFLDVGASAGASTDTRGMTFSPSGDRLYVINRKPSTLQVIDTSIGADGAPVDMPITAVPICALSSQLAVLDAGAGARAYVTCFQDGQLYVVDPSGLGSVDAVIEVGSGPYAIAVAPTRKKVYVTNFLEETIAVIDVSPTSSTQNRVVLRIGVPVPPAQTTNSGAIGGQYFPPIV